MLINATVLAAGVGTIATTDETSVTYDGVTFTFDRAMPVGFFVGPALGAETEGEPFVVSDEAFNITSITPASAVVGGVYQAHGTAKNPSFTTTQGFDGLLGGGDINRATTYATGLNIDPGNSGNIAVSLGEKASFVKSVRRTGITDPDDMQPISKYIVLTTLDAAPPAGAVRPGMSGTSKPILKRSDVVFVASDFAAPGSWSGFAAVKSLTADHHGIFCNSGERQRKFRLDNVIGTTTSGYSANIIDEYAQFLLYLNASGTSETDRQFIIDRVLVWGADIETRADEGDGFGNEANDFGARGSGAGQWGNVWLWPMASAALRKDAALHSKIIAQDFQPVGNGFWAASDDIGQAADGKWGISGQTYFDEHLAWPHIEPDEFGSHHGARYVWAGGKIVAWEQAAILAFSQGPAGKASGEAMILNGGSDNSTNQRAGAKAWVSRYRTWQPTVSSADSVGGGFSDLFDTLVTDGLLTPWTGIPDQPPHGSADLGYFTTNGNGAIQLDVPAGFDYATETITQRDLRYSLDGVQWVVSSNIGTLPYTESGLLQGVDHWMGWRQTSASGASPWSGNYPWNQPVDDGDTREVLATTGTEGAIAPDYTGGTAPIVNQRTYSGWAFETWEPAPSTFAFDELLLSAGVGYPSAGGVPTSYTYLWSTGATTKQYSLTASDLSTAVTCEVTATNASGSAAVTTAAITVPALGALDAGVLFQSEFDVDYMLRYETERLAATVTNGTAVFSYSTIAKTGLTKGSLYVSNTSTRPEMEHDVGTMTDGVTYRVEATLYNGNNQGSPTGVYFEIQRASDGVVLYTTNNNTDETIWTVDTPFTKTTTEAVQFFIKQDSGNGSATGPRISYLKISVVP